MAPNRDIASQLNNQDVGKRFSSSAGQRELVKEQIKLGKSPIEIEREERVAKRVSDMGVDADVAADFAEKVKSAPNSRESKAVRHPSNPGLERIIGENDLISSVFLERGAEATKSVCCIQENGQRIGTGFLVTPRVLLTNAHVIPDRETAKVCKAEFNYEDKMFGEGLEPTYVYKLAPDELFFSSPEDELDYTLVAVHAQSNAEPNKPAKPLADFGHLPLQTSVANALRGECLNILQHPDGAPKRLALRQNRFTALLERFVHYESDTLPGSSGSPVFNDQWQVICLHHAGVPLKDDQGRILTVDNRVWKNGTDHPALIKWIGNEGVRISRIIADVITQAEKKPGNQWPDLLNGFPRQIDNPPHKEEKLPNDTTAQTSNGKPQSGSTASVKQPVVVTPPVSDPPSTSTPDNGDVTITVTAGNADPIVIKVSPGRTKSAVTVAQAPGQSTTTTKPNSEPETLVERGLRNLERSQTRKYYEKEKDESDRESYFEGVRATGSSLREDLHELLTQTHTTRLSYRVARIEHLYAWVDLQRDKRVRSIYSDEKFNPERFITEDFTIERRLEKLVERRFAKEGNQSPEAFERLTAALEAQEPFNCEHVVPQSWFSNDAPMQGDLHHLYTCESKCNSFRGNRPYKDFGKFTIEAAEALRARCGFSEDALFEPFMGKGKVARATFYFLVRYAGEFENMYDDVDDAMETLLDWHERSEVTKHELHRNQAIFEIQGNRNPFIDHPDWARKVFGA